ncbi:hypothetical protein BDN72DRAFT_890235 [Pluteus cervinus]|uniref:Uncharacterized protein n=1 Tax=Pluteus cervinus TaxID=181527 RepID=A0ACD3A669_9AGAR|nr:hypothetical protein BDN72DRAFT_890235 [Pluteus cervinus]
MKNFLLAFFSLTLLSLTAVKGVVIPGAASPVFYLVASSSASGSNLLPLRINGGSGGYSTLAGSGPIGYFYFYQGVLTEAPPPYPPSPTTVTSRATLGFIPISTGCSTYGQLGFSSSSSDKCASYSTFGISSDNENSQLGAQLVYNYVGGFYSCGSGKDVWYKVNTGDGPSGCDPIGLWTVPVA